MDIVSFNRTCTTTDNVASSPVLASINFSCPFTRNEPGLLETLSLFLLGFSWHGAHTPAQPLRFIDSSRLCSLSHLHTKRIFHKATWHYPNMYREDESILGIKGPLGATGLQPPLSLNPSTLIKESNHLNISSESELLLSCTRETGHPSHEHLC
jgi:hypothetical protein